MHEQREEMNLTTKQYAHLAALSSESFVEYQMLTDAQKIVYWQTFDGMQKRNVFHRIGDWFHAAGDSLNAPNFTGK